MKNRMPGASATGSAWRNSPATGEKPEPPTPGPSDAGADIGHDDLGGPALVLFNRGADPLPVEPLVLWSFLRERAGGSGRRVYVLWSAETLAQPFLGEWLNRLGIFAATRANCRALLERGATVVAFPEGGQALAKTYERRYRLERFDEGALIETAMTCGARIVPAPCSAARRASR